MPNPLHDLRVAIGFLTRIPVGDVSRGDHDSVDISAAVPWFPIVGAGVGTASGLVFWALAGSAGALLAAVLAVACGLLITGAFHHDGLADMADAFGGGWTVEQRFEILKDSRLGTYGTAALTIALMVEAAAVAGLSARAGLAALVVAHIVGRVAAVGVMLFAPTAGDGLGASWMHGLSMPRAVLGSGAVVAIAAIVSPVLIVWPLIAAAIAALAVCGLSWRKIGGVTGDVLGAVAVCGMLASLVVTRAVVT